ncbi:hypothetical protein GU926_04585 [Nibribacter ruber]|uniref:Ava_C0101 and related proteins n=1 Tax=Nibribacter ruber TaxID=2698458 RepID=A0A6P1P0Z9_9BACT|nr:DUF5996 family protein [Nibribacter ruber]QHL86752.1 hypothetical protein GU926_04585 [Nibribacter ruber]
MEKQQWPKLSYEEAKDTYQTLHLWCQIVGKIKMGQLPWLNHSWHVTLQVTPSGFTTGDLPAGKKHFQINLDLRQHQVQVVTSLGEERTFPLANLSVAGFYGLLMSTLQEIGLVVEIHAVPNELENPIPFAEDSVHATYNPAQASQLHTAFLLAQGVLTTFRAEFTGKCSPVHLFWGSFDLAVSRFSGRAAPKHPGGVPHLPDWVAQEAYCKEVSSCGFWPGNEAMPSPAFYSYQYPEPEGYKTAKVQPASAFYHATLGEYILPYQEVQQAEHPEKTLLAFLRSTYQAGAQLGHWDRKTLERDDSLLPESLKVT